MAENKNQARAGGPGHGPGRGHGYQRPQNLRGTVGKLLAYIGRYKAALIVVAVCLVLSSVGSVASSYFLKPALNHIVAGDFKGLFWMLVAMGGVFLVSAGCSYAYSRIMVRISQRTVATCHGMNFPLCRSAFFAASSSPPQQGTSIRTTVTLLMSFSRMISVSFSA